MFTTKEAAQRLGLTKSTLEAWRCRGGGPDFVKMGRSVRYRAEDLEAFLQKNVRSNTSKGDA